MRNIVLVTEYDGSGYCGWQIQPNQNTVQGEIEKAIYKLTGVYTTVAGCSRTDRGVHAFGHVCNFATEASIPADRFALALNTKLPADIVVRKSYEADKEFHSRFSSLGKKYVYKIYNDKIASAILRNYTWHVRDSLDIESMKQAAGYFVGRYDFSAFQAVGSFSSSVVKDIYSSKIYEGQELCYEIIGSGFLYNMVRIITGTLVYVGLGKIKPFDIPSIIASRERTKAGITAPPQGLYLKNVYYNQEILKTEIK